MGRRAIRVADLADRSTLEARIDRLVLHHNTLRRGMELEEIDKSGLIADLHEIAPTILKYSAPVWKAVSYTHLTLPTKA